MATRGKRQRVPTDDCMRLRKAFAHNIRGWADVRGISLNHLADRSGVSRAQMYNVLSGSSSPSLDWIAKIAPALGLQVWELLVANPEPERIESAGHYHTPMPHQAEVVPMAQAAPAPQMHAPMAYASVTSSGIDC